MLYHPSYWHMLEYHILVSENFFLYYLKKLGFHCKKIHHQSWLKIEDAQHQWVGILPSWSESSLPIADLFPFFLKCKQLRVPISLKDFLQEFKEYSLKPYSLPQKKL